MQALQRPPSAGVSRPPSAALKRPILNASMSSLSSSSSHAHQPSSSDTFPVLESSSSLSEQERNDTCKSRKLCADDDASTRAAEHGDPNSTESEAATRASEVATMSATATTASADSAPSDGTLGVTALAQSSSDIAVLVLHAAPLPIASMPAASKSEHTVRKRHSASSGAADPAPTQQSQSQSQQQLSASDMDDMMLKMTASTNQAKAREMHLQVQLDRAEHRVASLEQQLSAKTDEAAAALARAHEQQCATERLAAQHEQQLRTIASAHEAQVATLRRELAAALQAAEQSRAHAETLALAVSEARSVASPRTPEIEATPSGSAPVSASALVDSLPIASAAAPFPLASDTKAALPQPQPLPAVAPPVRTSVRVSMYGGRQSMVMGGAPLSQAGALPPAAAAAAGWKIRVKEFNLSRFAQRTVGDHAFRELVQRHGTVLSAAVKQDMLSSGSTAEAVFATEAEANVRRRPHSLLFVARHVGLHAPHTHSCVMFGFPIRTHLTDRRRRVGQGRTRGRSHSHAGANECGAQAVNAQSVSQVQMDACIFQ